MLAAPAPTIFLSDCHLPLIPRPGQENWAPRVERFLREEASRARSLFIIGDLFDFWFEWRYTVPGGGFKICSALSELVRKGVQIHYLAGNHDGHLGRFLEREVGLSIWRQPVDAVIGGKKFHIIHGDGLAPGDRGYRFLRALVRWRFTESLFRLIHPDLGIRLAAMLSTTSRTYLSQTDRFGPEPYRQFAQAKLTEGYDFVIMGHLHTVEEVNYGKGKFLLIGDWIRQGCYAWFQEGECAIRNYEF